MTIKGCKVVIGLWFSIPWGISLVNNNYVTMWMENELALEVLDGTS